MKKRLLSMLLIGCMALTVLPAAALADSEKAIQLGTGGISGYDSATGYDYIYFGNWTAQDEYTTSGPIKWRVLDDKTNTGDTGLFLLSDVLLGTGSSGGVTFGSYNSWQWPGSNAQSWCNTFYGGNLTTQEQNAVLETTKTDNAFSTYDYDSRYFENILNGDKVFFLSAEEAATGAYGFTDKDARIAYYGKKIYTWWLRSYSTGFEGGSSVDGIGLITDDVSPAVDMAVRPAFNLNADSVLFVSAAMGGKEDAAADNKLTAVKAYTGNEWKLTLKDENRDFSANVNGRTSASAPVGGTVEIAYSGAQTGENEYVSAMLVDSGNTVLYYGQIAKNSASGTASITLPADLAHGNYTLKVFSEQCNGDLKTDYASAFQNISLTVGDNLYTVRFDPNGGTVSTTEAATDGYGKLADLPTPVQSGFRFDGWYTERAGGRMVSVDETYTADITLYAHWTYVGGNNYHAITAVAGDNGSISPAGVTGVYKGSSQTFIITPNNGYRVLDVKIDGMSIGAVSAYTFENVTGSHFIEVSFAKAALIPQTGDGGSAPVYIAMLLAGAFALAVTALHRRRES